MIFQIRTLVTVIVAGLALVSCRHDAPPYTPASTEFSDLLAKKYHMLSISENGKEEKEDAALFQKKRLLASQGKRVLPEYPENWDVRSEVLEMLQEARAELMKLVNAGMIDRAPREAANAIFLYDCWIQQEEHWWFAEETSCKKEFFEEVNRLSLLQIAGQPSEESMAEAEVDESAMDTEEEAIEEEAIEEEEISEAEATAMPGEEAAEDIAEAAEAVVEEEVEAVSEEEEAVEPEETEEEQPAEEAPPMQQHFQMLFAFDKADLDEDAYIVIDDIAATLLSHDYSTVTLNGHADRAGPEDYNMKLSILRAKMVKEALEDKGIDGETIQTFGFGESDPAKPTEDNVREPANRRVEVMIE